MPDWYIRVAYFFLNKNQSLPFRMTLFPFFPNAEFFKPSPKIKPRNHFFPLFQKTLWPLAKTKKGKISYIWYRLNEFHYAHIYKAVVV